MNSPISAIAFATVLALAAVAPRNATGQLRIVSYNSAGNARPGSDVVFEAIGNADRNGIARPVDAIALQEQRNWATSTQSLVDTLNDLYETDTYHLAHLDGTTAGAGRPGLIFNSATVDLIDAVAFGDVNTSAQSRQTMRYQLRPVGYDETADFFVYSNHYKAGSSSTDRNRRQVEALSLRGNLDALGEGTSAILAGDYNIRSANEASYQTLLAPGPGQAFDPIQTPGTWHNSQALKHTHTQSPLQSSDGGLIGGGVDDRFDFQLVTGELLDGEGLSYIDGSYHVLGNNGTHVCCDAGITSGTGAPTEVLTALAATSDHLPVIADYQLPAVMQVAATGLPPRISPGESVAIELTIRNTADVSVPLGADELDYTLTTSGDLIGSFTGQEAALGSGATHRVLLETSAEGSFAGTITVSSESQGVVGGFFELALEYDVMRTQRLGDFNNDGGTDGEDFIIWQDGFGTAFGNPFEGGDTDGDGDVDGDDFLVWQANFQIPAAVGGSAVPVPEPSAILIVVAQLSLLAAGRGKGSGC